MINDFNLFLEFDEWLILRNGKNIDIKKNNFNEFEKLNIEYSENDFLSIEFSNIPLEKLGLETVITEVLKNRIDEIHKCFIAKSYLSAIILSGSTLEGLLFGIATNNMKLFNQANCSPKHTDGKVKKFADWTLNSFIDVSCEVGIIKEDVKKFSHALKDFRNYIHPYEQMCSKYSPDEHTVKICLQVLKAAIYQVNNSNLISIKN